jgi:hypothetical protein
MADPKVRKFADGFVKMGHGQPSFYGLIKPPALIALVTSAGFSIKKAWINDQSGYVMASRP